jgi:hypothetical protein
VIGCGRDGCRKDTHNAIVLCVKDLASVAGIKARLEEQHCFREAFPDNGLKGDLSLWNVPDAVFPKTVCDATITHVAPGSMSTRDIGLSVVDALHPGRAAKKSMDQKNRKYSAMSVANNLIVFGYLIKSLVSLFVVAFVFHSMRSLQDPDVHASTSRCLIVSVNIL